MVKKSLCIALLALTTLSSSAQKKEWFNNVKLSGYGMTQYQYSDQKGNRSNSFNLRLFRLVLDGRILNDFYWKAQIQVNGNTSTLGSSPRLVDLFAECRSMIILRLKSESSNAHSPLIIHCILSTKVSWGLDKSSQSYLVSVTEQANIRAMAVT